MTHRDAGSNFGVMGLETSGKLLLSVAVGVRGGDPYNFYKGTFRLLENSLFWYQITSYLKPGAHGENFTEQSSTNETL